MTPHSIQFVAWLNLVWTPTILYLLHVLGTNRLITLYNKQNKVK